MSLLLSVKHMVLPTRPRAFTSLVWMVNPKQRCKQWNDSEGKLQINNLCCLITKQFHWKESIRLEPCSLWVDAQETNCLLHKNYCTFTYGIQLEGSCPPQQTKKSSKYFTMKKICRQTSTSTSRGSGENGTPPTIKTTESRHHNQSPQRPRSYIVQSGTECIDATADSNACQPKPPAKVTTSGQVLIFNNTVHPNTAGSFDMKRENTNEHPSQHKEVQAVEPRLSGLFFFWSRFSWILISCYNENSKLQINRWNPFKRPFKQRIIFNWKCDEKFLKKTNMLEHNRVYEYLHKTWIFVKNH